MPDSSPMLIAVAPNGARRTKSDHPQIPISPEELAHTAQGCLLDGAAMIHLHVRDEQGRHTILPRYYEPALAAIDAAVGDRMIVQVTSEAAGIYHRDQQVEAIRELMPACVSIAIRELIPDESAWDDAQRLLAELVRNGSLVQYIVYSPQEVSTYYDLIERGVIPDQPAMLLFVLGRYSETLATAEDLAPYIDANRGNHRWMCCAFGHHEQAIMSEAARRGGHARVGFENNLYVSKGKLAASNRELVAAATASAAAAGRPVATAAQARQLWTSLPN